MVDSGSPFEADTRGRASHVVREDQNRRSAMPATEAEAVRIAGLHRKRTKLFELILLIS